MASNTLTDEKGRGRRVRTFNGCGTCRRRHVKCDQVRPTCLNCKAVGVTCDGFVPDLRWVKADDDSKEGGNITRRHLYSEDLRRQMSESLTSSLLGDSVDSCLNEIDTRASEGVSSSLRQHVRVGPFSVLPRGSLMPAQPLGSEQASISNPYSQPQLSTGTTEFDISNSVGITGQLLDLYDADTAPSLSDSLQWDDLFELGLDSMFDPSYQTIDPLLAFESSTLAQSSSTADQHLPGVANYPLFGNALAPGAVPTLWRSPATSAGYSSDEILTIAPRLLKHLKDTVIEHICALPITTKSPFEIVNLASAIDTLAHLTILQSSNVTRAKLAGLYSLLSASALHLSRNPRFDVESRYRSDYWESISQVARDHAIQYLQQSIKEENSKPNKAKYKDQVAATMNLMTYSIMTGTQKDARQYMTDIERLMRLRGLAKRVVSRKSRLLHHMYTWCRIVGESTYVLHDHTVLIERLRTRGRISRGPETPRQHVRSGPSSRLDDFLRFENHAYPERREEFETEGNHPRDTALRDIHLEDSQENAHSLYGLIYGISERWLRLLSQSTRLANHMDAMKASGETSSNESLVRHAARLEDLVCSFAVSQPNEVGSTTPNYHIHCALNSALVIFFYRRIRNVNSLILQSHVDAVIQALNDFDEALAHHKLNGPGTVWPAFIAGCEAMTASKRDRVIRWIESAESKTGLACYTQAKEVLHEVWNSRSANGHGSITQTPLTWIDVLREKKLWLLAC